MGTHKLSWAPDSLMGGKSHANGDFSLAIVVVCLFFFV
jgi:hypothetical protein